MQCAIAFGAQYYTKSHTCYTSILALLGSITQPYHYSHAFLYTCLIGDRAHKGRSQSIIKGCMSVHTCNQYNHATSVTSTTMQPDSEPVQPGAHKRKEHVTSILYHSNQEVKSSASGYGVTRLNDYHIRLVCCSQAWPDGYDLEPIRVNGLWVPGLGQLILNIPHRIW